ncbi:GPI ethanolamine phosphate transferase 2 isoform X2 [Periplaneta americana]|uniref:GPI ethanolamine phosphate transferase 2 isoform X2 n=1 Tax=Periplaneta americana TaxID=6978 RepID=UPI0037E94561
MQSYILNYLVILGLCSILLFLYGFFPIKNYDGTVSTLHSLPDKVGNIKVNSNELYAPSIGRLVIMVIDALRWDFVEGVDGHLNMPYTASLIDGKKACLLSGKASPPTVTMPRIKAMTTGSVPNFIDVALNLGSSKIMEDNLLLQARNHKMKVIFYGDETWLKLFPRIFSRSEGTTSFFVSDYTEVDDNVTRHLATELGAEDWRLMILHYLGLDHIGHVEGPQSPLVRPKLQQMDRIVRRIHRRFLGWDKQFMSPPVLVVCGDHGMKNSGSHGGASPEEILVPIVVIGRVCSGEVSSDFFESAVPQTDLVPTLSMLLGLPIPAASLGKMIPQILHSLPVSQQLYALYYNCKQVATQFENNVANAPSQGSYLQYQEAMRLHAEWLEFNTSTSDAEERIKILYMSALSGMSSKLADSFITFDVPALVVASVLLWQIVFILALELRPNAVHVLSATLINIILLSFSLLWCSFSSSSSVVCASSLASLPVTLAVVLAVTGNTYLIMGSTYHGIKLSKLLSMERGTVVLVSGTILHTISLSSSSFVEEEHQVWYFLWLTFVMVVVYQMCTAHVAQSKYSSDWQLWCWLSLPILHRLLRKWNQTGDKWASLPDVGDWLAHQQHRGALSFVLLVGLLAVCCFCYDILMRYPGAKRTLIEVVLITTAAVCVYCYRTAIGTVDVPFSYSQTKGTREVRVFWSVMALMLTQAVGNTLYELKAAHCNRHAVLGRMLSACVCSWALLCALLHRPHNVLLVPTQIWMSRCVSRLRDNSVWWQATAHVWIGAVVYFYQTVGTVARFLSLRADYAVPASCCIRCVGYPPPLPSVCVVRVLPQAAVRGHAFCNHIGSTSIHSQSGCSYHEGRKMRTLRMYNITVTNKRISIYKYILSL